MIAIVIMAILLSIGVPVAYVLGMAVLADALWFPENVTILWLIKRFTEGVTTFQLLALPFFILAAELMNTSGITRRIYEFANLLVGHYKGGLGHVNVVGSMIFAGMSGSATADVAGLGKMETEAMIQAGYDRPFTAAVTAATSTIGPIIPPSIPFVVYGALVEESVGKMLLAGAIPGVLMGLAMMGVVAIRARQRNYPSRPFPGFPVLLKGFTRAFLPLLTPVILVGGIVMGVFTPTEAAIAASGYAMFLSSVVYRELSLQGIWRVFVNTGIDTGKFLFLLGMSFPVSLTITTGQIPQKLIALLLTISSQTWFFFLIVIATFIFLGFFLDTIPSMIIALPIFMVSVKTLGINPIHFGVVIILTMMVGLITPPFGMSMFIACDIAKTDVPAFVRESIPFYAAILAVVFLVTFVPDVALFLPNLFFRR